MKIELSFPTTEDKSEKERREYVGVISSSFSFLEKDIKELMYEQLISVYNNGVGLNKKKEERDFEVIRGNGIIEGMAILLEKWRLVSMEYSNKSDVVEDKNNPISEI